MCRNVHQLGQLASIGQLSDIQGNKQITKKDGALYSILATLL
jgi:hypothetical protein